MSWCRCTQPFGAPVLPDEYSQNAASSRLVGAGSRCGDPRASRSANEQRAAKSVHALQQLAVRDLLAAALDRHAPAAAFGDVAIDEVGGGIEDVGDAEGGGGDDRAAHDDRHTPQRHREKEEYCVSFL